MNTYSKYFPNVFLAKCEEQHEKGSTIILETRYGQEHECIVFNLIYQKDGFFFYSIVRADGFNVQEWAKRKAERLNNASTRANAKSSALWEASHEGKDFLTLAEPIKAGHHSEGRHRGLIERNHNRMSKSVEFLRRQTNTAPGQTIGKGKPTQSICPCRKALNILNSNLKKQSGNTKA